VRHNGVVVVPCPNCGKKNRVPPAASGRPRCAQCHQDLPWIAEANDDDFPAVVEAASLPVVVDLWAPWCGPCRMISPALEDVAGRLRGRLKLVKVNVDESPDTARRFGVQAIPTLLVFRHGQVVDRSLGARGVGELQAWIEPLLTDAS
jgi:thioredoxin 2